MPSGCPRSGRKPHEQRGLSKMIRSVVRGFGAALPKRVMTNRDLEDVVDTSDEWIVPVSYTHLTLPTIYSV